MTRTYDAWKIDTIIKEETAKMREQYRKTMVATNLEQSKKLVELGIDESTADMCWSNSSVRGVNYTDPFELVPKTKEHIESVFNETFHDWNKYWELIPAWSLSALFELMPKVNGHYPDLCRGKETGFYYMWIEDVFDTQTFPNPIDAAFEMIVWLKENKYI